MSKTIVAILNRSDMDQLDAPFLIFNPTELQRLQTFSPQRHQEFVASRWLLHWLITRYWHYDFLPEIAYEPSGRPYFKGPNLPDFSISHSGDFIMVAISDVGQIGLDVEVPRTLPQYLKIIQRRFSLKEIDFINQLTFSAQNAYFWRFWTIREALLKRNGLSVLKMRSIKLLPRQLGIQTDFSDYSTVLSFDHVQYVWAVAMQSDSTQKNHSPITMLQVSIMNDKIMAKQIALIQSIQWQHVI